MKLRHWLLIGFFCLAGGIIFWLWREGVISAGIALLGGMLSVFGSGTTVHKEQVKKRKEEVDRLIEDMRQKDREIERVRRQHDEEVKRVEKDYVNHSVDELIAGANERERKRRSDQAD